MIYTLLFLLPTSAADDAAAALALAAAQRGRVEVVKPVKQPKVNSSESPNSWLGEWHELQPGETLLPGNHWHRYGNLWKQHDSTHDQDWPSHLSPDGKVYVLQKAAPPVVPTQRYMRICENGRCRLVPIP